MSSSPSLSQTIDYLRRYYDEHSKIPGLREVQKEFSLSSTYLAHILMTKLISSGHLVSEKRRYVPGPRFSGVPTLGFVAAGDPRDVIPTTGMMSFDDLLITNPGNMYLVRVVGDSMQGKGIEGGCVGLSIRFY